MKFIFFVFFITLGFNCFAGAIDPVTTKISSDADKYYPLDKGSLILEFSESGSAAMELSHLLKTKGEDIRKINTTDLKVFGFTVGASFQTIDFETGKLGKFTFPKEVYIWMQKNAFHDEREPSSNYYRSFRVMLATNIEEVKGIIRKRSNEEGGDYVNGLAYLGEGSKFKAGKMASPLRPVPLTEPDIKYLEQEYKKTHPKFVLKQASKGTSGSRTFFKISGQFGVSKDAYEPTGSNLFLKTGNQKFVSFKDLEDPDYATFFGDFISGDIIEGTDGVLIREGDRMHGCQRIIILIKDKIEEVALRCDSGGC